MVSTFKRWKLKFIGQTILYCLISSIYGQDGGGLTHFMWEKELQPTLVSGEPYNALINGILLLKVSFEI